MAAASEDFESFLLSAIARNPALISETPLSIRTEEATATTGTAPTTASTLEPAHKALLAPYLAAATASRLSSSSSANAAVARKGKPREGNKPPSSPSSSSSSSAGAAAALLQRAIVDSPLLPLAGEHLPYETLLPAFLAAAAAAQRVRAVKLKEPAEGKEAGENEALQERWQAELTEAQRALAAAKEELARAFRKARWLMGAMSQYLAKPPSALRESEDGEVRAALCPEMAAGPGEQGGGAPSLKRARE